MSSKELRPFTLGIVLVGSAFGLWAAAALIGGLYRVNWQVSELVRQYLIATGMVKPIHTLVDFYNHIKGIEYIICVAFFVAFPLFFKYIEHQKTRRKTPVKTVSKSTKHT